MWHLGTWVRGGLGSGGLNVGFSDPGDLFQPNQFNDSMKIEGSAKALMQTGCQRSWSVTGWWPSLPGAVGVCSGIGSSQGRSFGMWVLPKKHNGSPLVSLGSPALGAGTWSAVEEGGSDSMSVLEGVEHLVSSGAGSSFPLQPLQAANAAPRAL